jgi:diketogulonate reductase-like aldo/keto reductase
VYKNEESVGQAIHESGSAREELYITTKYYSGDIQQAVRKSLDKVGGLQADPFAFIAN